MLRAGKERSKMSDYAMLMIVQMLLSSDGKFLDILLQKKLSLSSFLFVCYINIFKRLLVVT
jgi:hypothetical protein